MCGILGLLQPAQLRLDREALAAACRVQAHRGPDGRGMRSYDVAGNTLVLAHQRLSIIDLSDAGLQPMEYGSGEGSLIYNGELYNYLELRTELAVLGARFSTRTDTEVLLSALHHWGPERALGKFNWMGAFAWFDRTRGRLVLACDAGSEKPLYYCVDGPRFAFASEIKALLTLLGRKFPLDRDVVGQFVFQGLSDASTRTFFDGIRRIEAGSYVELDLSSQAHVIRAIRFGSPVHAGDPAKMSLQEFIEQLRLTFTDSVRIRLRSDVPVGVLLSGGIDSSSIAAVSQSLVGHDLAPRLLSAVSDDPRFDESPHVASMERHLRQQAHKIDVAHRAGPAAERIERGQLVQRRTRCRAVGTRASQADGTSEGPGTEGDSERAGRRRDSAWLSQVSRLLPAIAAQAVAAFSRLPPCSRGSSSIARS